MGIIPGMPNMAFLGLAAICGAGAYYVAGQSQVEEEEAGEDVQAKAAEPEPVQPDQEELTWDDVNTVDIAGLEVGYRLIPLVDRTQGGELMGRIKGIRKKLSQDLGFLIQPVHIRDNLDLAPNSYRISLLGVPVGEADIYPDRELAINPGQVTGTVQGIAVKDPAFGLDAVWIEPGQREQAQTMGYTVVDPSTVIATHLSQILQTHSHELIGHEEVQQMLDVLAKSAPKLVDDLIPDVLSVGAVLRVLQNLLEEKIPIRDMRTIAECLAEHGTRSQDPAVLTAMVRISLGRSIIQHINGMAPELPVITLDPALEQLLQQGVQASVEGGIGIEPGLADQLHQSLEKNTQHQEAVGQPAVLLVAPSLRSWLAKLVRHSIPGLNILSYNEVPDNKQIKVVSTVGQQLTAA
jgi:flagellar biosynthesis protein FlhA